MPELNDDQLIEIEMLIEKHGVHRRLSAGQKWDVALIFGALLVGSTAIAGLGIWQGLSGIVEKRVGEITANNVAQKLRDESSFQIAVARLAGFPKNSVVAFAPTANAATCPDGWSIYTDAVGKFLLGADEQSFLTTGGEREVTLTEAQMPKHNHRPAPADGVANFYTYHSSYSGTPNELQVIPSNRSGVSRTMTETDTAGESEPHNNMPPYIALYFCKKD